MADADCCSRGSLHLNESPTLDVETVESPAGGEASIEQAPDRMHRAAKLADYGYADDGALGATLYATRVLMRRGTLLLARRRLEGALTTAQHAMTEALLPLGKSLCGRQDDRSLNELAPMFEAVEAARREARDKDTAREQLRASSANVQKEIDDSRSHSETAASRIRAQETELAAQETQLRMQLKRAQGLLQRCDIELRALQTAVTPADPNKVQAILKQRQERDGEAQAIQARLTALLSELGETRRSLASARGVMSDLESKGRDQAARHQKVDRKHAKFAAKAHSVLESSMVDVAAAALDKDLVDLSSEEGLAVAHARSRVAELQHQVDDHVAADAAYDTDAYGLGVKVLGGIALSVTLLVVLIVRG